jgi:hypothetical protein
MSREEENSEQKNMPNKKESKNILHHLVNREIKGNKKSVPAFKEQDILRRRRKVENKANIYEDQFKGYDIKKPKARYAKNIPGRKVIYEPVKKANPPSATQKAKYKAKWNAAQEELFKLYKLLDEHKFNF